MFSGIIEDVGVILNVQEKNKGLYLDVKSIFLNDLSLGESVAHNGVCLTITKCEKDYYTVYCVHETLSKTNLKRLQENSKVNLERSLLVSSRVSGHFVQGHVDCIGECYQINNIAGNTCFRFKYPKKYQNLIFEKGSICINGVSLTISKVIDPKLIFEVCIIPHTLTHSTFQFLKKGESVNLEFDMMCKQINRSLNLLSS